MWSRWLLGLPNKIISFSIRRNAVILIDRPGRRGKIKLHSYFTRWKCRRIFRMYNLVLKVNGSSWIINNLEDTPSLNFERISCLSFQAIGLYCSTLLQVQNTVAFRNNISMLAKIRPYIFKNVYKRLHGEENGGAATPLIFDYAILFHAEICGTSWTRKKKHPLMVRHEAKNKVGIHVDFGR